MLDASRGTCMLPNLVELYVAHSGIDQLQNQNTLKEKYTYILNLSLAYPQKQGLNIWAETRFEVWNGQN